MNFVLDASVSLALAFEDERDETAMAVLNALKAQEAITSSIWPLEVGNGLLTAVRRGRMTAQDAARFSNHLLQLPVVVDPVDRRAAMGEVRRLAGELGLSVYDASYLEIALRRGLPLATGDARLREAAERVGVAAFAG